MGGVIDLTDTEVANIQIDLDIPSPMKNIYDLVSSKAPEAGTTRYYIDWIADECYQISDFKYTSEDIVLATFLLEDGDIIETNGINTSNDVGLDGQLALMDCASAFVGTISFTVQKVEKIPSPIAIFYGVGSWSGTPDTNCTAYVHGDIYKTPPGSNPSANDLMGIFSFFEEPSSSGGYPYEIYIQLDRDTVFNRDIVWRYEFDGYFCSERLHVSESSPILDTEVYATNSDSGDIIYGL